MVVQYIMLLLGLISLNCHEASINTDHNFSRQTEIRPMGLPIYTGADQTDLYIPLIKGARVGLLVNQTSITGGKHLVDVLMENNIQVSKIFAPEHGFRGEADAGARY
jgi:uncharacterized protein YbbC (DUF1343 family)